ncbi:MAG: DNA polymerase II [Candidatus Omnitrophica bacterium]|nr:DNA polymerase II [Candidatus Omnitrophota bacterium]
MSVTADVFILTSEYEDVRGRHKLRFYGRSPVHGPVEIVLDEVRPVFFIAHDAKLPELAFPVTRHPVKLRSMDSQKTDALYFRTQKELYAARDRLREARVPVFESDVHPCDRFLMERFIRGWIRVTGPAEKKNRLLSFLNPQCSVPEVPGQISLTSASIDIETESRARSLYSAAVHFTDGSTEERKVFMRGPAPAGGSDGSLVFFETEAALITALLQWFEERDPDIVLGWNVVGFDLAVLEQRSRAHWMPFLIGRANRPMVMKKRKDGSDLALIPGRVILDGPAALRASFYTFDDYKLETVAQTLLGEGKSIRPGDDKMAEINRMFQDDKEALARYNLQDAVLVSRIFEKTGLIRLAVKRTLLSGLLMDQIGMSSAAFDYFFLPRLHRKGIAAPNTEDSVKRESAAGGYVISPRAGLYDHVLVLDFKSLYPTIIQTFRIDPLSRLRSQIDPLKTPRGYAFSRTESLLPDFIGELMEQRAEAKRSGDTALAQAIKILMNSFYGVMGSPLSRFYHPDLPAAITSTGQWLLVQSRDYLERKGLEVLYGDTDSLFVRFEEDASVDPETRGRALAGELNRYWKERIQSEYGLKSCLEIEFETYFRKFLLPMARNREGGAKKRYAGLLVRDGQKSLHFTGMEFVRSDWTRLAKDFQEELYRRLFEGEKIEVWIRDFIRRVKAGEMRSKMIYRKRLLKPAADYTQVLPPHVKAALLLKKPVRTVDYVITLRGPVPTELPHEDLDFDHYIEKQIRPIADSILEFVGKSFDQLADPAQLSLFDSL